MIRLHGNIQCGMIILALTYMSACRFSRKNSAACEVTLGQSMQLLSIQTGEALHLEGRMDTSGFIILTQNT